MRKPSTSMADNNNMISIFENWLAKYRSDFNYPPFFFRKTSGGSIYKFKNITKRISIFVGQNFQLLIFVQNYDILKDFEVHIDLTESNRYFCKFCIGAERKYYSSISKLVEQHSLKLFLEWANENLHKENRLLIFPRSKRQHVSSAKIVGSKKKWKRATDEMKAYPLVISNKNRPLRK